MGERNRLKIKRLDSPSLKFEGDACFLDIETTGLSPYSSYVNVVGLRWQGG